MGKFDDQDLDEKRLLRRQRRKRSQLIAYICAVVILLVVIGGAVFGIHYLKGLLKKSGSSVPVSEEVAAQEASETDIIIETPEETEVEEMSREDVLTEIVDTCISEMSIEDKVAGLFIVTPEQLTGVETAVKAGSGTQDALAKYAVGGITYFAKNIKSESQISEMLSTTTSMSKYPLFTMTFEEGTEQSAITAALEKELAEPVTDVESAEKAGAAIGQLMNKYGFNMNLAPLVVFSEEGQYGDDTAEASSRMTSFMIGLKSYGVDSCAYSFPMSMDTKEGEAISELTSDELSEREYVPFKDAIAGDNVTAIMVGNVSLPNVTGDNTPASLSEKIVTDELRSGLSFKGLVISGPLNEKAVTDKFSSAEAAIKAVAAGADMLYLCDNFEEAYNGLLESVKSGEISENRIDESLRRIYRIKYAEKADEISN